MNSEFNNQNMNQFQNNSMNNQYSNNYNNNLKSDKWKDILILILVIIVFILTALSLYFVIDKKDNDVNSGTNNNQKVENGNNNQYDNNNDKQDYKNLNYKIVEDNNNVNFKHLYVNNKEVLAGIDMKVNKFNYDNIIVTMILDGVNKIYFVNNLGEVSDLNFLNSSKENIKYHHSYYISENSIVVLAEPGLEYQTFKNNYCSLYVSDAYYSSSNITRDEILESIAYKIKYEFVDGKIDNKVVIEEKSVKEGFSIENCKSKSNFISYIDGYICVNHNDDIICFNELEKNKEKLENIFGRENCYIEKEKYICKINDAWDHNGNGMEAYLNLNTNVVSDYIYRGLHCYESRICQNEI